MLRAVTFDLTGTLIHSPDRGAIYSEVLARHGGLWFIDESFVVVREPE